LKNQIHNRKFLESRRKSLRSKLTSAEATLWKSLQGKKLVGRKFRRQHSIENYIVDFYCALEKLVIELDGAYHFNFAQQTKDEERTLRLQQLGFKVIRFENKMVFEDLDYVLDEIKKEFGKRD